MTVNNRIAASEFSSRRGFLNAGIATLAFVLTCVGLNAILPFPEINIVASNLRFFKKHEADFDTIFIGSSRIHHQISPAIFDRIMREQGQATRSFNFGVNGMFAAECNYVLERLLRAHPNHLKWVFIELDELETRRFPGAEGSRRAIYWRDWKRTSLVLRKLLDTSGNGDGIVSLGEISEVAAPKQIKSDKRDLLFFHLSLFGKNVTNVSRKIDVASWASRFGKAEKPSATLGRDGDGYEALAKERMTQAEIVRYEDLLNTALSKTESRFVSAPTEEAYRQMAEGVRKAGATPVFLMMPAISQIKLGFRPESGITGRVMSFNDIQAFPQLYRRELWGDAGHLNAGGAEEFTAVLAQNFSELVHQHQIQ